MGKSSNQSNLDDLQITPKDLRADKQTFIQIDEAISKTSEFKSFK